MTDAVCLITAPVSTDFEESRELESHAVRAAARAPKLGILALAAVLERAGLEPCVFDLDRFYEEFSAETPGLRGFAEAAGARIAALGCPVLGFSSLCSSYPLSIRIAECAKRAVPDASILFGGPQASATDRATLAAFPFVDFILRGEADLTLPLFLDQWSGARQWHAVPGLTWRSPFGVQRNADAPVIDDLDALPLPAFHHAPGLQEADYAFLELGRGCPFACTFCSTNDFFRRKFRVKSPERMLADMRAVAAAHGFRGFNLVHDMFTVDRRRVAAFCETMIASGEGFRWSCSARTDCVDDSLLELMARAGCDSVFFGIETGSRRMQRIIDKDLDLEQSRAAVETCERFGMQTTVSLIAGFPEETESDLRETLDIFVHSLRHPRSAPQVNILAPLSGTPVYEEYKDRLVLDDLSSQLAYTGPGQCEEDRELVRRHPAIFPNVYLLPTPHLDRPELRELAEFLPLCAERLRWLTVALDRRPGGILDAFRAWRERRQALYPAMRGREMREYYTGEPVRRDLAAFLRAEARGTDDAAVEALVSYEAALAEAKARAPAAPMDCPLAGPIGADALPLRVPGVHVVELDWDVEGVIDWLRGLGPPPQSRARRHYRMADATPDETCLTEIAALAARVLACCDGAHTVAQLACEIGPLIECPEELPVYAAVRLLDNLRERGFIEVYAPASSRAERAPDRLQARFQAG